VLCGAAAGVCSPLAGDEAKGKEFAAERIAAAVSELRDMIIDAWRKNATRCVMLKPASQSR